MNTDKILKEMGYGDHPRYPEIARWAASNQWVDELDFRAHVMVLYPRTGRPGLKAEPMPINYFLAPDLPPDGAAINQLKTAMRLPVAVSAAAMPDLHKGYSLPIGGVAALQDAVSPAFVGYDISCMIMLTMTEGIPPSELTMRSYREALLKRLLQSTSFGLGSETQGMDHPVMNWSLWNEIPFLKNLKNLAASQLGSSGAGNHFADIVTGVCLIDSPLGTEGTQFVALMTHSGSRGVGNKIGHHYSDLADRQTEINNKVTPGYGWFDRGTELFYEYMQVMDLMGYYAKANHEIIHDRFFRNAVLPMGGWLSNQHNFAWETPGGVIVHRKGATPAGKTMMGIIPGSSGTASYVVMGKGNESSLNSASHGAGRPRSRTASKALHNEVEFQSYMENQGITHHGIAKDETWQAYKPIQSVIDAQKDLIDVVAVMRPKVVVMGGMVDAGDGD